MARRVSRTGAYPRPNAAAETGSGDAASHCRVQRARFTPDRAKPGHFEIETGKGEVVTGRLSLEVELKDATGDYEFTWAAD